MKLSGLRKSMRDIDMQVPIDLSKFKRSLELLSLGRHLKPEDIVARKISGQKYLVMSLDYQLKAELEFLLAEPVNNRVGAARQNRSHKCKVEGSLLVLRRGTGYPQVVMFEGTGRHTYPGSLGKTALLIENRQNFISIEKTDLFLTQFVSQFTDEFAELTIIFAEGNEISNSLHKDFLNHFEHINLFLDLDVGGLTIAANLLKLLPEQSFSFLLPDDIGRRLDDVVEVTSPVKVEEAIKIGLTIPLLAPAAKIIKDYRKTLEQESYLYVK
ncbi:hypothetical protein [Shewanella sp. 4_MG-2023]|uniref:hypothetical protein n=1 Tax=Shewanella sp. 4_MG-2023 TaxID=3062652 RepID=UPI0026E47668|nr:hypothetical protein [Shewanella sp. 4_MG-2023]MDO6677091.1 hypothetical protein [Shewanella sp. 4_MG-2023]